MNYINKSKIVVCAMALCFATNSYSISFSIPKNHFTRGMMGFLAYKSADYCFEYCKNFKDDFGKYFTTKLYPRTFDDKEKVQRRNSTLKSLAGVVVSGLLSYKLFTKTGELFQP